LVFPETTKNADPANHADRSAAPEPSAQFASGCEPIVSEAWSRPLHP
jgi:hypothetical protein